MRDAKTLLLMAMLCGCSSKSNGTSDGGMNVVGPAGGTVSGPDGVKVSVPAGALSTSTTITIEVAQTGDYPPIPSAYTDASKVYAFLPHGLQFTKPVTIDVPIASNVSNPVALHADPNGTWTQVSATLGTQAKISTSSFSFYTVATTGSSSSDGGSGCVATFGGGLNGTATGYCLTPANPLGDFLILGSSTSNKGWVAGFDDPQGGWQVGTAGWEWYSFNFLFTSGSPTTGSYDNATAGIQVTVDVHRGANDAHWNAGGGTPPLGAVTLDITSLGPEAADVNGHGPGYPDAHGTFQATLVDQNATTSQTTTLMGTF